MNREARLFKGCKTFLRFTTQKKSRVSMAPSDPFLSIQRTSKDITEFYW